MLKLTFESLLNDLDITHDFEMIYEFIKAFSEELTSIKVRIIEKKTLKSNHYWLMAIIPKLKKLKSLKIYKHQNVFLSEDFYKFLEKAMTYFHKNGGSLTTFGLNRACQDYQSNLTADHLFPCLKAMPDVQALDFS
jgi:hypothetical protein